MNKLTELPELPETLITLLCARNNLHSLPTILPPNLKDLECSYNQLQVLPELPKSLEILECSDNQLQTLPKLPESLIDVKCSNNKLFTLPKLPPKMTRLICNANPLIFIEPLAKKPKYWVIPVRLNYLHRNHYSYRNRYETYCYLISFLILECRIAPVILNNEFWWFCAKF